MFDMSGINDVQRAYKKRRRPKISDEKLNYKPKKSNSGGGTPLRSVAQRL